MTCTVSGDHNHGDRFKSPKDRVVGSPSKWANFMAYKWG